MTPSPELAIAETRAWVARAVIGLNLCPFAKAVQVKDQIRYVHCPATEPQALLDTLRDELTLLSQADPAAIETTLLVHPQVLADFLDFNDFLGAADDLLHDLGLGGELQIASFHPQFQFAGTDAQDLSNATNRSPHPCLHLLREQSIERAVASFPEPEAIFEANIRTLEVLGAHGWAALQDACRRDAREGKRPPEV